MKRLRCKTVAAFLVLFLCVSGKTEPIKEDDNFDDNNLNALISKTNTALLKYDNNLQTDDSLLTLNSMEIMSNLDKNVDESFGNLVAILIKKNISEEWKNPEYENFKKTIFNDFHRHPTTSYSSKKIIDGQLEYLRFMHITNVLMFEAMMRFLDQPNQTGPFKRECTKFNKNEINYISTTLLTSLCDFSLIDIEDGLANLAKDTSRVITAQLKSDWEGYNNYESNLTSFIENLENASEPQQAALIINNLAYHFNHQQNYDLDDVIHALQNPPINLEKRCFLKNIIEDNDFDRRAMEMVVKRFLKDILFLKTFNSACNQVLNENKTYIENNEKIEKIKNALINGINSTLEAYWPNGVERTIEKELKFFEFGNNETITPFYYSTVANVLKKNTFPYIGLLGYDYQVAVFEGDIKYPYFQTNCQPTKNSNNCHIFDANGIKIIVKRYIKSKIDLEKLRRNVYWFNECEAPLMNLFKTKASHDKSMNYYSSKLSMSKKLEKCVILGPFENYVFIYHQNFLTIPKKVESALASFSIPGDSKVFETNSTSGLVPLLKYNYYFKIILFA